jgi:phage-related protein
MKKLEAYFFKTSKQREPVKEWLQSLSKADKKIIGEDILTVQYAWPLGMPLVANLGQGLWEVRSKLEGGRISRIIFFMHEDKMILVNGFFKKSQKTPQEELELAKKRKSIFEHK